MVLGLLIATLLVVAAAYIAYVIFAPAPKPDFPRDGWFGSGSKRADDTQLRPFKVSVPEEVIEDLKKRLANSRISHEVLEDANTFEYGFNVNYLREVLEHWQHKFDWRKQEEILNAWPQFTTEIEGVKVHYYHAKPDSNKYKKVVPLLIVHGWPGNVFEFYKILPMLLDPAAHNVGSGNEIAFEVVAPSIPGYGFSEAPKKKRFSQLAAARVFKKLMDRIGHKKYYLQGGDWGSIVTSQLARMYPEKCFVYGLHVNMASSRPSTFKGLFYAVIGSILPQYVFKHKNHHTYNVLHTLTKVFLPESGYMHIQATKPDTVGTGLNDSPMGLAAYILEKFSTWTNGDYRKLADGGLTKKFTLDELLTIVTIYWTQGNIVASQRFYKEAFADAHNSALGKQFISVPTAHAQFPNELFDNTPAELLALGVNLTSQHVMPDGAISDASRTNTKPMFSAQKTMPTYKLTYFDGRGRGEVARQLFHIAGVPFEDIRIPMNEWEAFKAKTKITQVPILEVDGKVLTQAFAINRYIARQLGHGLAGTTLFEEALVDSIADLYKDYIFQIEPALKVFLGFAPGDKEQLLKDVFVPAISKYFGVLEKIVKDNGMSGHFVGSSITWVDLLIADHVGILLKHIPGILRDYPAVLQTIERINATPKLKEWIAKRADTVF